MKIREFTLVLKKKAMKTSTKNSDSRKSISVDLRSPYYRASDAIFTLLENARVLGDAVLIQKLEALQNLKWEVAFYMDEKYNWD